jgi:hypothetical protein
LQASLELVHGPGGDEAANGSGEQAFAKAMIFVALHLYLEAVEGRGVT